MVRLEPKRIKVFRRALLSWYCNNGRNIPWRATRDPYPIYISEIMLQQTQVSRVIQKLPRFLQRFPTLRQLAEASNADIVRAWQGMGYNIRALRLREAARITVAQYHGTLPSDPEALDQLPGIGRYTAHAIACFAYGKRVPVVDVNIRRVISRVFRKRTLSSDLLDENVSWEIASAILPRDAYRWNQALMDLGATICKARNPACGKCPIGPICKSKGLQSARVRDQIATKHEPMHDGIPRRIWRGRIVEELRRAASGQTLTLAELSHRLGGNGANHEWLESILMRLDRDGMIHIRRRGRSFRVGLAAG